MSQSTASGTERKRATHALIILTALVLIVMVSKVDFFGLSYVMQSKLSTFTRTKAPVEVKPRVMLTMFTTFKSKKDKFQTYSNTLRNWALFLPQIQPLLFIYETDENLIKLARSLGWLVAEVPRLSKDNVPIWKYMYFAAQNHSDSIFYGYFNGDILFDDGLLNTVSAVEEYLNQLNKPLIIGRRTNLPLRGRDLWKKSDVTRAAKEGELFLDSAEDYFILARNQFVWDQVVDVVIGRPAYDNYLVALALNNKLSVIDATETILTLHQTGEEGNSESFHNKDYRYNYEAMGEFKRDRGHTTFAPIFTKHSKGKEGIELWQRPVKEMVKLSKCKC